MIAFRALDHTPGTEASRFASHPAEASIAGGFEQGTGTHSMDRRVLGSRVFHRLKHSHPTLPSSLTVAASRSFIRHLQVQIR